jgi:outer membrane protein, multidrug efflux system
MYTKGKKMKWTSLGTVFLLGACASAPKVEHPDLAITPPAAWSEAAAIDIEPWWTQLGDAQLDTLVEQALASNYDLRAAAARLDQAQAQARIAGAPLQPSLGAGATGSRRKQNFVGFPIPGSASQVLSTTSTNYGVNLNLSWEIDLWGKLRAGAGAALADAQAAKADFYGAQLSLAAQTSRAYFAAVEARRQVELASATVDNYQISSEQINSRYLRGLSSSLELRLGRSNLAAAEATLAARRQQLDRALRQLELLLGRYPSARMTTNEELPSILEPVPAGLAADLVARRPDLAAAERRLAAATGRLAQSRRALFPSISLTASTGTSSSALGDLLNGDFSVWNLVGNISQPLLQGGRLRAGVDLSQAGVDGALATYAQSVLKAYAEVELALAAEGFLQTQEEALKTASSEARAARVLAEERYAKGLSDLITLLDAQRRAFDAESRLLSVRRQRLDSRIDLYLALGGGFVASQPQQHAETTR